MIKEKIDRQKRGQSPATPFMQMTDSGQTNDSSSKKGVTFDVMETLERHSDSIDRLTCLVSKMNVKMDKKEAPHKPRVYQNRPRGIVEADSKIISPTIGPLVEIETELEGIIIIEIIDPTLEIDPGTIIAVTTEENITGPMRDIITTDRTIGWEIVTDNRNRQNYRGNDSRQRERSESRDRLRNYSNDSS